MLNELLCAVTHIKMTFLVSTSIHLLLHIMESNNKTLLKYHQNISYSPSIQPTTEIKLNYDGRKTVPKNPKKKLILRIGADLLRKGVGCSGASAQQCLRRFHLQLASIDSDKCIASDKRKRLASPDFTQPRCG